MNFKHFVSLVFSILGKLKRKKNKSKNKGKNNKYKRDRNPSVNICMGNIEKHCP